ncbi:MULTISPECIES: LysR family transcriptional regulator [Acinetobacter]|uniref:LysR family transcriptional regulator n=1 Tax=Acinetobacter piscicola TaxID=2006115 RepID=A0A4Q4GZ45_9GAMM|nr:MULTISPECIES: LysR family transcriptional regulator [Acinetobacter]MDM1757078.1 LysR family transcriptional regulator [Acinetobacter sp. 256-1]MDM1760139.1 LysR family transcriptional regulator [Acinetobacter sp. 251-1]QOW46248.1 LysR family transcriptional regulator [Acinetobacter piscicola]RYL27100.1 LysR family transcriptional regulator [Acinetobacter piscicola]
MELRHLRYFVAVVEEQSFTKAAEKLFIAQPPLSRQIQNLENELDVQLFIRGSRPLKTTEAGQFFYQHAVKLLSNAEEVKSMTKRVGLADRTLNIGFVGSLLFGLLSNIVYLFKQQNRDVKIEMVEMTTTDQIEALKEGRIDVGFGRLRISDSAVKRVLLREEPLMVAVHASSPLVRQYKEGVYLADLLDQHILLYPNHHKPNFSTQVRHLFSEYGLDLKNVREVRELQLALGFVAAAEGISIVPSSAQNIHLSHLHFIPLLDDAAVSPIFMAMRNMDENNDIHSLFDCVYQVYDLEHIGYERRVL